MGFLTFLAVAASIAYGLNDAASGMKTRSCKGELAKENYSLKQFETILRLHRVKRIKMDEGYKVLPENGYASCLNWIEKQPLTDESDIQEFIDHYNAVREQELDDLYQHWDQKYDRCYDEFLLNQSDDDRVFVLEKKHVMLSKFSNVDYIKERMKTMYDKTFWGDVCVKPGKLVKDESSTIGTWLEIWVVKCPGGRAKAEEYYKACEDIVYFENRW